MAEWVDNRLKIIGPAEEIARFKRIATPEGSGEAFGFEALVAEWTRSTSEADPKTRHIREELGARLAARMSRDSSLTEEGEGTITYFFESEWNPPHSHVAVASALFPSLTFLHDYEQMSLGWRGRQVLREGIIVAKARGDYGPDGPEFYDQTDPLPDIFAPYLAEAAAPVS